jgi:hypothetical protein
MISNTQFLSRLIYSQLEFEFSGVNIKLVRPFCFSGNRATFHRLWFLIRSVMNVKTTLHNRFRFGLCLLNLIKYIILYQLKYNKQVHMMSG